MEHVRGRVLHGDEVLYEDLDIAVDLFEFRPSAKQYKGCFQLPHGPTGLNAEGPFQLDLEDGRSGRFYGPQIQQRQTGIKVSFTIDGALSKRKPSS
jgi:hypothetical protein